MTGWCNPCHSQCLGCHVVLYLLTCRAVRWMSVVSFLLFGINICVHQSVRTLKLLIAVNDKDHFASKQWFAAPFPLHGTCQAAPNPLFSFPPVPGIIFSNLFEELKRLHKPVQTSIIAAWSLCSMKAMAVTGVLNRLLYSLSLLHRFHVYKVFIAMT